MKNAIICLHINYKKKCKQIFCLFLTSEDNACNETTCAVVINVLTQQLIIVENNVYMKMSQ